MLNPDGTEHIHTHPICGCGYMYPRRWREVKMSELQEIWAEQAKADILYNGCTHAALVERYGKDNIKHEMGYGWYKLTR
jgi:hypothetical protein